MVSRRASRLQRARRLIEAIALSPDCSDLSTLHSGARGENVGQILESHHGELFAVLGWAATSGLRGSSWTSASAGLPVVLVLGVDREGSGLEGRVPGAEAARIASSSASG